MGRDVKRYQCACCGEMRDYRDGKLIAFSPSPIEQGSAEQVCPSCTTSRPNEVMKLLAEFFEERKNEDL